MLLAACSLQGEWRTEYTWTTGFIDRIQPAQNLRSPLVSSLVTLADQVPQHAQLLSSARRQLHQSGLTYQATVAFTLSLTSQLSPNPAPVSQDLSTAIKQATAPLNVVTTIIPAAAATNLTLNVSILFPPGNTVSATPSQATAAAVTLTTALTQNPAQAFPSLYAKDGAFQVLTISISDALVPQGVPSSTQYASPVSTFPLPNSLAIATTSSTPVPSLHAVASPVLATSTPSPVQAPSPIIQGLPAVSVPPSTQASSLSPTPPEPVATASPAALVSLHHLHSLHPCRLSKPNSVM